jgi:hypothetical protein
MLITIERNPVNSFYDFVRFIPTRPLPRGWEQRIELRHAKVVAKNLLAGKPYYIASPLYSLDRQQMAAIHINAERILAS